jgi:superfamily II DNA or RNA helicase
MKEWKWRPYQADCLESVINGFRKGINKQLCVLATGSGKRSLAVWLSGRTAKTLFYAHNEELIDQAYEDFSRIYGFMNVGIVKGPRMEIDKRFVVASPQTMINRLNKVPKNTFSLVQIDECFPIGTFIDGVHIKDIQVGMMINSYNHYTNTIEKKKVLSVFSKLYDDDFISIGNQLTTKNHPYYTIEYGYIPALFLTKIKPNFIYNYSQLHNLQQGVCNSRKPNKCIQEIRKFLLFERMLVNIETFETKTYYWELFNMWESCRSLDEIPKSKMVSKFKDLLHKRMCIEIQTRSNQAYSSGSSKMFRKDEKQQSNEQSFNSSKDEGQVKRKNIFVAWREWPKNKTANHPSQGNWISYGIYNFMQTCLWIIRKSALLLQGRSCYSGSQVGNRSGWKNPQTKKVEIPGQKKNRDFSGFGLGCATVYKRRSGQRIEISTGKNMVYNIEVEGNQNYFVDGKLVHNCHRYMARTFHDCVNHFNAKRIGWTATPRRLDGLSLMDLFDEKIFEYNIIDGIRDGFLCELDGIKVKTEISLDSVGKKFGDFNETQLGNVVNCPRRNNLIVQSYLKYARDRQFIAFCVNTQHAIDLKSHFDDLQIPVEIISSDTTVCPDRKYAIGAFKCKSVKGLINVNILCLDLDTEILTNSGWKRHDQMTMQDKVANWNFDGKIYFKEPEEIVKRNLYDFENMVSVKSKTSDIRVTNTHRMIYINYSNTKNSIWKKCPASELVQKNWSYPLVGIAEPSDILTEQKFISNPSRRIIANAYALRKNNGLSKTESLKVAIKRLNRKCNLKYKNPSELTLDECRFIGFWLGDGSINRLKRQGVEYTLCQSKVYPNIVNYVDKLIKNIGLHSIKRDKGDYFVWSLNRGTGFIDSKLGLYSYEPYLDKNGSQLLWGLSRIQLEALIEGLWFADGLHRQAEKVPETKLIGSTFYELLSLLQAVAVCRGISANMYLGSNHKVKDYFKKLWYISFQNRSSRALSSSKSENLLSNEPFKQEQVWCVKTETKNIITRRNGRVCIMGNTEGFDYSDVGAVLMARPTQSEVIYFQAIGRGTRLKSDDFEKKFGIRNCVILDFVDNTSKHKLVNTFELDRGKSAINKVFVKKEDREKLLNTERQRSERTIDSVVLEDKKIKLIQLPDIKIFDSPKMNDPATDKQIAYLRRLGIWDEFDPDGNPIYYTKLMASEAINAAPAEPDMIVKLINWGYNPEGATVGHFGMIKTKMEIRENLSGNKFIPKAPPNPIIAKYR